MRTVAVILGDNDFSQTFWNLLETVKRIYDYRIINRDCVKYAILEGALYHYRTFQNGSGDDHIFNMITILFDEEAESDILNNDHNHGAWYLHFDSGQIGSY